MTSTTHVLAAVFRAVNDMLHSRLKSRNVHSEIVFSFSPNNNVSVSPLYQHVITSILLSVPTPRPHDPFGSRPLNPHPSTDPYPLQIADSFRRFGISDTTRSLLAIKVANVTTPSSAPAPAFSAVQSHLRASVDGTPMPFTDESLRRTTDMAKVRKLYKLDSGGEAKKGAAEKTRTNGTADGIGDVDERREVEAVALGMMALKGS